MDIVQRTHNVSLLDADCNRECRKKKLNENEQKKIKIKKQNDYRMYLADCRLQIGLWPSTESYGTGILCSPALSTAICHNIKLHVYTNSTGI